MPLLLQLPDNYHEPLPTIKYRIILLTIFYNFVRAYCTQITIVHKNILAHLTDGHSIFGAFEGLFQNI